ncbi:hypothetical protein HYH03_006364 [Edaphochlamys debaryana]|uniref:Uncharacterized protein n=1 Tax=Edaphochlamys debaryana TaxID=47281 RepID=A0A836C112_9CHLO|nr:hypothetical protein HYH03_006364 [Edaphochlamys debaryana]|eukprot:KAG2495417.1 hypothetical protein HYH03_006364 [Edaphochlamys debaryana]
MGEAEPKDGSSTSFQQTLEGVRAQVGTTVADAQAQLDGALQTVAGFARQGLGLIGGGVREAYNAAADVAEAGTAYANHGLDQLKAVEDATVAEIRRGLDVVHANPYVSYPLLATGGMLLLPGTRRLLYRATLGRLRSVDNILKGSEGKVEGLRVKMGDFSSEAKKLQERLAVAEDEYVRGRQKLKATRQELQRLASVVAKSERQAAGVLEDLRSIKKADKATQLRAEAASQVSSLRAQRTALQSYIYRIASKDI